jgi:hypothetical protein
MSQTLKKIFSCPSLRFGNCLLIKQTFKNRETSLSCPLKEQGQRKIIFIDDRECLQLHIEIKKTLLKQQVILAGLHSQRNTTIDV